MATAIMERMSDRHDRLVRRPLGDRGEGRDRAAGAGASKRSCPRPSARAACSSSRTRRRSRASWDSEDGFEKLWQSAADMLTSYSDEAFVSDEYGQELSAARTQALEVERVSDDPPERVQGWLATVIGDARSSDLDLNLLLDLLDRGGPGALGRHGGDRRRRDRAAHAPGRRAERAALAEALVRETTPDGRPALRAVAAAEPRALWRRAARAPRRRRTCARPTDAEVESLNRLCHTIGAGVVRPLAEALAVEETSEPSRRLRELLLGFGAAGRQSVEQLKNSPNPAVRRTAIDLLRVFGGQEALPELASMLDDADPQVQRESIRAIVQIGTQRGLRRAASARCVDRQRHARDRAAGADRPARRQGGTAALLRAQPHAAAREAGRGRTWRSSKRSAASSAHPESTRDAAHGALPRRPGGRPFRTATLRRAAATALKRIGSPEATAVLEEAVANGQPRRAERGAGAGRHCAPRRKGRRRRERAPSARGSPTSSLRRLAAAMRGAQLYAPGHPLVDAQHHRARRDADVDRSPAMPVDRRSASSATTWSSATSRFRAPPKPWAS